MCINKLRLKYDLSYFKKFKCNDTKRIITFFKNLSKFLFRIDDILIVTCQHYRYLMYFEENYSLLKKIN